MNKKELEEFLKNNPGADIEEYKKQQALRKKTAKVHDNLDDMAK